MFMGGLSLAMAFQIVPKENHDYMLIILGAMGGAMGVTGGSKAASAVSSSGPDTHVIVQPAALSGETEGQKS